jgi:hypothetical protein
VNLFLFDREAAAELTAGRAPTRRVSAGYQSMKVGSFILRALITYQTPISS